MANNLTGCKNIEYICFLLEENSPQLVIEGVDFLSEQAIKTIQNRFEKEEKFINEAIQNSDDMNKKFVTYLENRQLNLVKAIEGEKPKEALTEGLKS